MRNSQSPFRGRARRHSLILALAGTVLGSWLALPTSALAQQDGVQLVGRWLTPNIAPTASYAGSAVRLSFYNSSKVSADFTIPNAMLGQDVFISITVDGGKPRRLGLSRGTHRGVVLASGLSQQLHVVAIRKEGESAFGTLQFTNPKLDADGSWQALTDDRPIVEVIGDSFATGICALGPDAPATSVSIHNSAWASETDSWVGVLEAELAGVGHPVDMVDLAISGSTAGSEAQAYDYTAPGYSDAKFYGYSPPGHPHATLVFLWGGGNDRHDGGDLAGGAPVTPENLSPFERGDYDQLTKIFARNPDVRVVLLEYIDVAMPDWTPAYEQIKSLLPETERARIFVLPVYDPKKLTDACEIDPRGHPNVSMHIAWATQILTWIMTGDRLQRLGFPDGQQWYDDATTAVQLGGAARVRP